MRFASLGSGSRGNATLIERGPTRLLLDCGFSLKETCSRLARLGLSGEDLTALLVSHEHRDHISGAGVLAREFRLPLWATPGTLEGVEAVGIGALPDIRFFNSHEPFAIDGIEIMPFPVPHDAREPCHFVFSDGRHRIGVLTDAGSSTPHIERCLTGCDALAIECNHDLQMLAGGPYPPVLKKRVGGPYGHLDNNAAAEILSTLDVGGLQHLVAMHVSEINNSPALVRATLDRKLGCGDDWIKVADQEHGLDWCTLL